MQRLTLCVIAKNEEAMLPRCLASVRGLVDAIVVVDTGSTDRTPEIAREHGATVVQHAWDDDFAAARNAALPHVAGGFVLVLDADEVLGPGARSAIRKALRRADFDCGMLALHDADALDALPTDVVAGRARRATPVLLPRLLRRTPDLAWEGIVHEQVGAWVRRGKRVANVPAAIVHYGAVPALREARAKNERNRRLLERRCELEPGDPIARAYLVREIERVGDHARARGEAEVMWSALEASASTGRPTCDVVLPATLLAYLAMRADDPTRALQVLERAREWGESHPNLELLTGWAHEAMALRAADVESFARELEAARQHLEHALTFAGRAFPTEVIPGASAWSALTRLGTVTLLAGDLGASVDAFRQALRDHPDPNEPRLGLVEALLDASDPATALRELQPALDSGSADAWLLAAACAHAFGGSDDARLFLDRARAALAARPWIAGHRQGRFVELETELSPSLVTATPRALTADSLRASVVIPAYNRLDLLRPVLEGFLGEARQGPFELLVVDDGSQPAVRTLLDLLGNPSGLRLVERPANGGRAAALNSGLDAARGDVVIFCDSDIVPTPGFVRDHLSFHRRRNDELATHLGALDWGVDAGLFGALLGARANPRLRQLEGPVDWTRWFTDNWSFRRSLCTSRGLRFDERYRVWGWEELDFARRLIAAGATSELTSGARGLHLKPATPQGMIDNLARSIPNLLRLAGKWPHDETVQEWLGARCASREVWNRANELWSHLWSRVEGLDQHTSGALRNVADPAIDALAIALSDLVFRLGVARGFLDTSHEVELAPASDLEFDLALAPCVAHVGNQLEPDEAADLDRTALGLLDLHGDERRKFQERVAYVRRHAPRLALR